jgi:hypothetical protein
MTNAPWIFGDVFVGIRAAEGGQLIVSQEAMVARICQNCTYHMIYAAKPMGLIN